MPSLEIHGRDPEPAGLLTGLELWSLIGDADALADASDATYVQAGQHWTGSGTSLLVTGPSTRATMDETPIDPGAGDTFDRLVIRLRFQQTVNTRVGVGPPFFRFSFTNDFGPSFVAPASVPLIDDGAVHDYEWDWTPEDNGFEFGWNSTMFGNGPVSWEIGQGADLLVGTTGGSGDTQHRIFEASLVAYWTVLVPTLCLQNAERSSCIHIKHPDGSWGDLTLVGG